MCFLPSWTKIISNCVILVLNIGTLIPCNTALKEKMKNKLLMCVNYMDVCQKALCWVKEARHRNMCFIISFMLISKTGKTNWWKSDTVVWSAGRMNERGVRKRSVVIGMFCILFSGGSYADVHNCQNSSNWTLKICGFFVHKLLFHKINFSLI